MACEEKSEVDLYIYDLTNGLASLLSPAILGHRVEGIWHTSIVVYGREIFYGGSGIVTCAPGSTQLGQPHEIQRMGETYIPHRVLNDYIEGLSNSTYKPMQYHLLSHNCNHFTEELSQFLCGSHIPKYILEQSARALPPPLRTALERLLDNMNGNNGIQNVFTNGMAIRNNREDSPDFLTLNNQIEEARSGSGRGTRALAGLYRLAGAAAGALALCRYMRRRTPPLPTSWSHPELRRPH